MTHLRNTWGWFNNTGESLLQPLLDLCPLKTAEITESRSPRYHYTACRYTFDSAHWGPQRQVRGWGNHYYISGIRVDLLMRYQALALLHHLLEDCTGQTPWIALYASLNCFSGHLLLTFLLVSTFVVHCHWCTCTFFFSDSWMLLSSRIICVFWIALSILYCNILSFSFWSLYYGLVQCVLCYTFK